MKRQLVGAFASLMLLAGTACTDAAADEEATAEASQTDPDPAMNAPDELAWQLFIDVMTPVEADGPAAFESWASDGDTFRPDPVWPSEDADGIEPRTARPTLAVAGIREDAELDASIEPDTLHNVALEHVARNQPAFDYIVENDLYSVSGLQAAYANELTIDFPTETMEVKTNWLSLAQLVEYYPAEVANDPEAYFYIASDSGGEQYALIAMHVISKQVPNWTWATFEHFATPGRCDIIGCRDSFGAQTAYVPPATTPEGQYGACAKSEALEALLDEAGLGALLGNYCLKGSQTDFTDPTGLGIRLGNSVTEGGFIDQSSCMTCHATASFNAEGQAGPVNALVGAVPADVFWSRANPPYLDDQSESNRVARPADFVWSVPFCAYDDVTDPNQPAPSPCAAK